jgi:hypothetical protein
MKIILTIAVVIAAFAVYTAWLNDLFKRCPYCRKIGSCRFDPAAAPTETKDEDRVVVSSVQIQLCRRCGKKIEAQWSATEGRRMEKIHE